ncbi:hypothetical protein [Dyella sp. C9]|uniref:hypothetical protein n=1 Tax=Dyella sp. C9 TaxID=2202154 RepID=UPI000DEF14A8|nr:hypothetical protein [Dyella sp. C9]
MKAGGKYWFGRKRLGWGFGPRSWQGWLTTLAYGVLMVFLPRLVAPAGDHGVRVAVIIGLTVAFFAVFLWKLDTSSSR